MALEVRNSVGLIHPCCPCHAVMVVSLYPQPGSFSTRDGWDKESGHGTGEKSWLVTIAKSHLK